MYSSVTRTRYYLAQEHVGVQTEIFTDQHVCDQERNSSRGQEDLKASQIKVEEKEVCINQEGGQFALKQENDAIMMTPTCEESEPQPESDQPLSNSSDIFMFVNSTSKETLEVINKSADNEVELSHQHRRLDSTWNPVVKLYRIDLPQQHVCDDKEILTDQQVFNQEWNFSPDQKDPEPPQITEEQAAVALSHQGEQLVQNEETDAVTVQPCLGPPAHEQPNTAPVKVIVLSTDSDLALKTKTFTGEKLYRCNTCGKTLKTVSSFKRHNARHTGERPYTRNSCGRKSKGLRALKGHVKTQLIRSSCVTPVAKGTKRK
ncbi:zinc finger protein 2 homolog isoform X2 [Pundamilia nyererei]|uniref:Zinc finger protein 2 homolog isoform X2 n=1 Tax=Pundamilia nyererei TaxID=303518 RepID=A0A9Y3VVX0_9CICH|nr:PREDICTED: zinc finger protein 2 homolog isoform X2 [Pundamilia nyererei]